MGPQDPPVDACRVGLRLLHRRFAPRAREILEKARSCLPISAYNVLWDISAINVGLRLITR